MKRLRVMDLIINTYIKSLYILGVYRTFHFLGRHKITIIYIHGIMESNTCSLWTPLRDQLSPQQLMSNLKTLSQRYTFISLSHAINILNKKIPPINNALVITLDDGYFNNIKYGAAIFKQFNIIPSLYISTEHTQHNRPFWFDRLDYALQQITENYYKVQLEKSQFHFDCRSHEELKASYTKFRKTIKKKFTCDIQMRSYLNEITSKIEQETGKSLSDIIAHDDWSSIASWQQLTDVVNDGSFDIGNHTLNHARLALVDETTMSIEIQQAKEIIEQKLAIECNSFCYPDNSYNLAVINMIQDQKYACGLTTETGLNSIGCNMQTLKRFSMPLHNNPQKTLYIISALRNCD